jgi:hypothetical protein
MQFRIAPGWLDEVYARTDVLFLTRLGPEITADAKALCPVFGGENSTATAVSFAIAASLNDEDYEPGALRDSIHPFLQGHSLIVIATGSGDRAYAAAVELGHRIVVFRYDTGRRKGPSPFLRPALYQLRAAA